MDQSLRTNFFFWGDKAYLQPFGVAHRGAQAEDNSGLGLNCDKEFLVVDIHSYTYVLYVIYHVNAYIKYLLLSSLLDSFLN